MTVLDAVIGTNWGGTFGDRSIARDRPDRGDPRRPEPGGNAGLVVLSTLMARLGR